MTNKWDIPAPVKKAEYEWYPIMKTGYKVPFGYKLEEEGSLILLPVPKELELLEQAKKHLKEYSYRAVANWLSEQAGRPISHVGLMKRVKSETQRAKQLTLLRSLEKKLRETIQKIERLERDNLGGSKTKLSKSDGPIPD